jgi:septal ring factor EnvC (AmiA/AmiB activator)
MAAANQRVIEALRDEGFLSGCGCPACSRTVEQAHQNQEVMRNRVVHLEARLRAEAGRVAELEAALEAGRKDRELLRNVHAAVVSHRDRLIESVRELRGEVEYLREQIGRIRELAGG